MNTTILNDHTNNITMALNYHTYKKIKDSYLPVLALTPKFGGGLDRGGAPLFNKERVYGKAESVLSV
jgi:hypothetical protein